MVPLLILIAAIIVVSHAFWVQKRGRDPLVVIGDIVIAFALLILIVRGSGFLLNYSWWKELGQEQTFWQYVRIRWEPQTAAVIFGFVVLASAFVLGKRHSRASLPRARIFSALGYIVAFAVSFFLAVNFINPWRIALWLG